MKTQQRWCVQLLVAVAFVGVAVWYVEAASTRILNMRHDLPAQTLRVSSVPSDLGDGERLVHLEGCYDCHGPLLTGAVIFTGWFGTRIVAPNLTRVAHRMSGAQLSAAIRYGVDPDGHSLIDMPSNSFVKISDSDAAAIVAYLRSLPEKHGTSAKTVWAFGGKAMVAIGLLQAGAVPATTSARGPLMTPTAPLALGHYLTRAYCAACHGSDLSGETAESSPDLRVSIQHYSPAAFLRFFKTGVGQFGHGTSVMTRMIRHRFKYLTVADVQAIYAYLKEGWASNPTH